MNKETPAVYVITGPTASGKSALAVELAKRLDTEVISADSRQIYKGIPIVTAVPSEEEKGGIAHHLLEILNLDEYYSASLFENQSLKIIDRLLKERGSAVICGGSMMYVDALCHGIDNLPTVPEEIRKDLMEEWNRNGDDWLRGMLKNLDPDYWGKIDLKNLKRIFHAIEISITAGQPYSTLTTGEKITRPFTIKKYMMDGERNSLFDRINSRVDRMIEAGLEEEARGVYAKRNLNSLNTVGLKEMFAFFDGILDRVTAIERIKKNTRVYAKKQITWHKRDKEIIKIDFSRTPSANAELILSE